MADEFQIEVLEDGTIKSSTDKISGPNHSSAENFLREMARMAGGTTTRTKKPNAKHEHSHGHGEHEHQH